MNLFNLHTHSNYCDGKEEPRAYVLEAIKLGYHTLGFSSHAPVPFENKFAIPDEASMDNYFKEIRNLKKEYSQQIRILLAMEIDYIPGILTDFSHFMKSGNLDYTIGGVHLIPNRENGSEELWFIDGPYQEKYDHGLETVFNGNPRKGVEAYYAQLIEMIGTQQPDIIAHLDKIKMHNKNRFFEETERWYTDLVWKTLNYISSSSNSVVEVNTRGLYKKRSDTFFPGPEILDQIHHLNIPVTLNSDAHHPSELNGFYKEALELLKDIGFKELVYYDGKERKTQKLI